MPRRSEPPGMGASLGSAQAWADGALPGMWGQLASIRRRIAILEGQAPDDPQAVEREQSKRSLGAFMRLAWPSLEPGQPLKWGWCLDAICDHLQAVSSGHIRRLIITVPPGFSKSVSTCVYWPAWEWGPAEMPHLKHLTFAYHVDLSTRDNRRCRMLINSEWYQGHWGGQFGIAQDQNQRANFENTTGGWRKAASIGGAATGYRADRVIIDDPLNVKDANSEAVLQAALLFTDETLPTRLIDPQSSAIVWIMQRVHERDPVGHLLARNLGYVHLNLPMEFEADRRCVTVRLPHLAGETDPLRRSWATWPFEDPREEEGDLLFPERFPAAEVEQLKRSMGSYATASQFQMRPGPRGGGMLKSELIGIVDAVPAGVAMVRSWDLAASDTKATGDPDWTRGALCALHQGLFYILNLRSIRAGPGKVEALVQQTAQIDGYDVKVRVPQDPGAAGKAVAHRYLTTVLLGFPARAEIESGDKATRADPLAAAIEAGNVRMLKGEWNDELLDEFRPFPFGRHDDIVDAVAAGFNFLARVPAPPEFTIPIMDVPGHFGREF